MSDLCTVPVATPDTVEAADAARALARRHLLQQLDLGTEAARTGRRELDRLAVWMDERQDDLVYGAIDRGCGHTARLISALARLATAQTASALAPGQAQCRRHRAPGRGRAPGGRGEGV